VNRNPKPCGEGLSGIRIALLTLGSLLLLAGCAGFAPTATPTPTQSTLEVVVQNDDSGAEPITVSVVAPNGTVVATDSDTIQSNVGRSFEFTVETTRTPGSPESYTVRVEGSEWATNAAWPAEICERFRTTVRFSEDSTAVSSECVDTRTPN
jgi:hypothetical protein